MSQKHCQCYIFYEKCHFPAVQIVKELKTEKVEKGIKILRADNFLKKLEL